ncbi:MAG: glycosyltransferase family 2 protein [bacterium]|nr:glycosyltransferase family 2 protein [bacterium]
MKKISFSIIIPTYNRERLLQLSIQSVLNQTKKDFEILILDDASTDMTQNVINLYHDKRIRYIRNPVNKGVVYNFRQGFKMAQGTYIFLLSDDDFILRKDTLEKVFRKMEETNAGIGHLSVLFYEDNYHKPTTYTNEEGIKSRYFAPSKDILMRTKKWHFGFMSGNIYRRSLVKEEDLIDNVWYCHVKPIFRAILLRGVVYFGDLFIIGKLSTTGNISYLNIHINKTYHVDDLLDLYKEFDSSQERYKKFEDFHLHGAITTLPGVKYFTSNKNISAIASRLLQRKPSLLLSPTFWFYYTVAFLTPKRVFKLLRRYSLRRGSQKTEKFAKSIHLRKHLEI